MDEIGNVLDRIHEHMMETDRIDPQYRQAFLELDKNIRAMKRVQDDNASTELASGNGCVAGKDVHAPCLARMNSYAQNDTEKFLKYFFCCIFVHI